MSERIAVVGIGADGWSGLAPAARERIEAAEVLMGSARQLDLVPAGEAERVEWPSPLVPALPELLARHQGRRICVLASGDPVYHGIATTLVRLLGADRVDVVPHPSSVSLACARLGWPADRVTVLNLVGRPVELLHRALQPGRRVLLLGAPPPAAIGKLVTGRGYGESGLTVLEQLGGPAERIRTGPARAWDAPEADPLTVIALDCRIDPGAAVLAGVPGLPDEAYEHDGQLTKREVRAVVVSRLAPVSGGLLWDVGAGAGSIAIEWARTDPACRAVAIERDPDRAARIERNAAELGVPGISVVKGAAPAALAGLEPPDAVFVGGGGRVPGVLDTCWRALRPGGRLVVTAVTIETEAVLADWYRREGGDLVRIGVQRASAVGGMTGWRPAMPVTIWSVTR